MAKLISSAITSLDGYIADEDGRFDWAMPDEEVLAFINDLARQVGTHLYGRRMYETMAVWETLDEPEPDGRRYDLTVDLPPPASDRIYASPSARGRPIDD